MKSRVYPKYKTKYRVGHWRTYEQALVQRGDVPWWRSADATATWRLSPFGRPGGAGRRRFSDLAIETAWTLRRIFSLPVRQPEGCLRSVLFLLDVHLEAPDHPPRSRRHQRLAGGCLRLPPKGPRPLVVASPGLSSVGAGEWAAATHGGRGPRGWRKLPVGVDRSGVIVAKPGPRRRAMTRRLASIGLTGLTATGSTSPATRPTTQSPSPMSRGREARPSWSHRTRRYACL